MPAAHLPSPDICPCTPPPGGAKAGRAEWGFWPSRAWLAEALATSSATWVPASGRDQLVTVSRPHTDFRWVSRRYRLVVVGAWLQRLSLLRPRALGAGRVATKGPAHLVELGA